MTERKEENDNMCVVITKSLTLYCDFRLTRRVQLACSQGIIRESNGRPSEVGGDLSRMRQGE